MRYHNITKDDMLNGEGIRVVLWVAGCEHACEGCHNPITWDEHGGLEFDEAAKQEIFDELEHDYVSGITLSGGDPLFMSNREGITQLCTEIRDKFPTKTIWLYTGYRFEEVRNLPVMQFVDVVVDGRFIQSLKDVKLPWRGSENQRVIDVPKTFKLKQIVLLSELDYN